MWAQVGIMKGQFRKYDHLERAGHAEVKELVDGDVWVFPKLDGTNASVWWDGERVQCGSRNRVLTVESDNAGFCAWVNGESEAAGHLRTFVQVNSDLVVYGEWLVPHSLKTYREEAWRRFWIFDVWSHEKGRYLSYADYAPMLGELDVIEPLCTMDHPSDAQILARVETNTYLIADGAGLGEGVVLKNYDWANKYGRQPWLKVVRNSFKEENKRAFGTPHVKGEFQAEVAIVDEFVTAHLVGKTRAKVVLDVANEREVDTSDPNFQQEVEATYRHKVIPQFLGRVWHDLIHEEMWAILKKHKNAVIDFGKLNGLVVRAAKKLAGDLF